TLGFPRSGSHQTRPPIGPQLPTLPTELWEVIFDQILAIPFLLDTRCSPIDFYFFAAIHRSWDAASAERESYGERWKTLRAVCRRWKAIVDRHAKTWIRVRYVSSIPPETKRVDIVLSATSGFSSETVVHSPQISELAFGNLQVVSLSEHDQDTADSPLQRNLTGFISVLRTIGYSKPPVHSFIYEGNAKLGPPQLQAITNAFPHLTSLTLFAKEISGTITLPTLHLLWISGSTFDISQWDLRSLRHLALGDPCETVRALRYEDMNVGNIKDQLLSIMILYPYWVSLSAEFWDQHLSLQFFGSRTIRNKPTRGRVHNARILCTVGPTIVRHSDLPEGFFLHIHNFPNLQTLITPNKELRAPQRSRADDYQDLMKYCAAHDIT
ncbi:hypothetical protein FRC17_006983, partial [Serendipita sp. 399]